MLVFTKMSMYTGLYGVLPMQSMAMAFSASHPGLLTLVFIA